VGCAASAALRAEPRPPAVCQLAAGSTTKLLVRLHDGLAVEAVVLRHDSGAGRYGDGPRAGRRRATLCLSSQVGCAMGCTFCATGRMGMQRNLSAGEIAEQVAHALASLRSPLQNVVFMGMGEPLNNYAALIAAIRLLTAPQRRGGFGLAPSRVTVSTVGVIPRMRTLAADAPGVRLALSLHAPSQAEREVIVPSASTFPLARLLDAATAHERAPGGAKPLIEYVLLRGVNDSGAHAAALGALLAGRGWSVNLIPYNRVFGAAYDAPSVQDVVAFQTTLRTEHGINTTVRRTMGQASRLLHLRCVACVCAWACSRAPPAAAGRRTSRARVGSWWWTARAAQRQTLRTACLPPLRDVHPGDALNARSVPVRPQCCVVACWQREAR
jgi:adenine C2-methylase RlmN of 23S rRNA A2503 and tRNA A37